MGFGVYLVYLFLTYSRFIEMFAPQLMDLRPMVILWVVAFLSGIAQVMRTKVVGAQARHFWALAGFVWSIFMSQLFAGGGFGGAWASFNQFSATAMLYVLTCLHVTSVPRLVKACGVILVAMILLCLAGIASYHLGFMVDALIVKVRTSIPATEADLANLPVPSEDGSGVYMYRIHSVGFFDDPNDFAQMLVSVLPWVGWLYRPKRWGRNLMVVWVPAGIIGYTIFLTHSRGALLGVGALLFFGVRKALGTFRTMLIMGAMGAVVAIGGFTGGRGFSSKEESAEGRVEAWAEGLNMLKSSPLFGVGYGNFLEHHWLTAHNAFVLCFAEVGFVGFFFWLALIVLSYQAVNRLAEFAPEGSDERRMGVLLRSSLVGFMTCAWFLSRTYQPTLYVLLALCVCAWRVSLTPPLLARAPQVGERSGWVKPALLMLVGAMLLVQVFVTLHYH